MYALMAVSDGMIIRETEKAVLVELSESDNWRVWMPKSVVRFFHLDNDITDSIAAHEASISENGHTITAKVPAWFAYKNGLVFRTRFGNCSVQMIDG